MSSDESDIDLKSAIPRKTKNKTPTSPSEGMLRFEEPKKLSTKVMVRQALTDLKTRSRKGVSFKAIKKYIHEQFKVDVERNNYIIKKFIKTAVENGSIIQIKGVGASGSFKLAVIKEKIVKKKKETKKKAEKPRKQDEGDKKQVKKDKPTKASKVTKATKPNKKEKEKSEDKTKKVSKTDPTEVKKPKTKVAKEQKAEDPKEKVENPKKKPSKMSKIAKTPAKKRAAMMKRKSIGSIIKPPKMKPNKK